MEVENRIFSSSCIGISTPVHEVTPGLGMPGPSFIPSAVALQVNLIHDTSATGFGGGTRLRFS